MRLLARWSAACLFASMLLTPRGSSADEGFALDRFEPAERGSSWFVLDSLDMRGHVRHAVGLDGEVAYKPLVVYNADGSERAAIIKVQPFVHLGASLVMWNRLRVGFNLPMRISQTGDDNAIGSNTFSASHSETIGDLRLGSDVRLFGTYGSPITMAAGLQVWVPTGDRASYTGDGKARLAPRVLAAGQAGDFGYSAQLAFNYRPQDDSFGGSPMGSEMAFGVAAGLYGLKKTLLFGPEVYGRTGVSSSDAFFGKHTSPVEALLGVHYQFSPDFNVNFGIGPGLSRGLGSPVVRSVLSIEWHPAYEAPIVTPPPDADQDSVFDQEDALVHRQPP